MNMNESVVKEFMPYSNMLFLTAARLYDAYIESGMTHEYAMTAVEKRLDAALKTMVNPTTGAL